MVQNTTIKPFLTFLITCLLAVSFGFGQCIGGTVTWNGTWNGIPDSTTEVIIAADYDTGTNGSFSACSLIIFTGAIPYY